MKTIYEIYVPVTSQEQADRLKAICVKYGLPIWEDEDAFVFVYGVKLYFNSYDDHKDFAVSCFGSHKTPIAESEFLLLAKEFKQ
jgi:hypothetical protein